MTRTRKLFLFLAILGSLTLNYSYGDDVNSDSYALTKKLAAIIDEYDFPGMTATVISGDHIISGAAGYANREASQIMTSNTRMLAASVGKTFLAATFLHMEYQGLIDLDNPISKWLGYKTWFKKLPNSSHITIRHLLQHTSGLADHVHLPSFKSIGVMRGAEIGPEGLIALILEEEALFAPGTRWSYTDTGYLILGLVAEEATGLSYEYYLDQVILSPTKLINTGPSNKVDIIGLARGYVSPASGLELPAHTTNDKGDMVWNPRVEWTGGGLYSTSFDLARWGQHYLSGKLFGPRALSKMTEGVRVSDSDPSTSYGLGLAMRLDANYGMVRGHRGWIPGYVSSLQYYPRYDVSIAFQINTDVGIIDSDKHVVLEIENRLIQLMVNLQN